MISCILFAAPGSYGASTAAVGFSYALIKQHIPVTLVASQPHPYARQIPNLNIKDRQTGLTLPDINANHIAVIDLSDTDRPRTTDEVHLAAKRFANDRHVVYLPIVSDSPRGIAFTNLLEPLPGLMLRIPHMRPLVTTSIYPRIVKLPHLDTEAIAYLEQTEKHDQPQSQWIPVGDIIAWHRSWSIIATPFIDLLHMTLGEKGQEKERAVAHA